MASRSSKVVELRPEGGTRPTRSIAPAFSREILAAGIALLLAGGIAAQAPDRGPATADPVARQAEAQAKRAADRLAALQHEAETLATQERTLLAELRKLELDLSLIHI